MDGRMGAQSVRSSSAGNEEIAGVASGHTGIEFEDALAALKRGRVAKRNGWHNVTRIEVQRPEAGSKNTEPYLFAIGRFGERTPWLASQTDLFARDWVIL